MRHPAAAGLDVGAALSAAGPRIALIGADDLYLAGLGVLLAGEGDFSVQLLQGPGAAAQHALRRDPPALAVVEFIDMDADAALARAADAIAAAPATPVVGIIGSADPVLARDLLQAGVHACLTRSASKAQLFDAVCHALRGDRYLCPAVAVALATLGQTAGPLDLNVRERKVLQLIGRGYTNREIGHAMHLSVRTIETHRASLVRKTGLPRRADLVRHAALLGLRA